MKKPNRTRGRSRSIRPREPSGRPQRQPDTPPWALTRRAEIVGIANAKDQRAGYALGQARLMTPPLIDQRQFAAGMQLAALWAQWAALAGIAPHETTQRAGGIKPDPAADDWATVSAAYGAAVKVIRSQTPAPLRWQVIENLCIDNVSVPHMSDRALTVMREALDDLADHFFGVVEKAA